jgi:hypothetical protein
MTATAMASFSWILHTCKEGGPVFSQLNGSLRDDDLVDIVRKDLAQSGLVVVHNLTELRFERLFDSVASRVRHRDSDDRGVTSIQPNASAELAKGYSGFSRRPLPLHTDGSSVIRPPDILAMYCVMPATEGGAALVADGREALFDLAREHINAIEDLQNPAVEFRGTSTFVGPILNQISPTRWTLRFRDDDLVDFTTAAPIVDRFRLAISRSRLSIDMHAGDAYLLRNDQWLHGRDGFVGYRLMKRLIGVAAPGTDPGFSMNIV